MVLIFRPPLNAFVTPKRSTTCPLTHEVKYGARESSRGGWMRVARGQRLSDRGVVLALRDVVLVEHLGSTRSRRFFAAHGMLHRVEGDGRGDHAREQRRLGRLELGRAVRLPLLPAAAEVLEK